jgi:predicted unusual protein kinase regulating ubiquinone biosynthesis (AarF/ABC1/UbiB family)
MLWMTRRGTLIYAHNMASVVHPALGIGWINGARLDTSEQDDVPRLCAVALAAYLAMLLDIGVLHADPHPGNLFRTDDGKLCILDW